MSKKIIDLNQPSLFKPSDLSNVTERRVRKTFDYRTFASSSAASSGTHRHYTDGKLRSTQQLNIDFSRFENHTFFNSAVLNVNMSFDKIINSYPYDGKLSEVIVFEDKLSGFEKYILDRWPKNKGYLNFGANSYVEVVDVEGSDNPSLAKNPMGRNILDPGGKTLGIEFSLKVPDGINLDNQIICQKYNEQSKEGFSIALSSSDASSNSARICFSMSSGSVAISEYMDIQKGGFNQLYFEAKREKDDLTNLKFYMSGSLILSSSTSAKFGKLSGDFKTSKFLVGSGSNFQSGSNDEHRFIQYETLSGSIDELRIFHGNRSIDDIRENRDRTIFGQKNLKLKFTFNEPHGDLGGPGINNIVLDSSGNALHGRVINYNNNLRLTSSDTPMVNEDIYRCPTLFPACPGVTSLNSNLMLTASNYDKVNPNLITRLVPRHYFNEQNEYEGSSPSSGPEGTMSTLGGSGGPGSAQLTTAQTLSAFLYIWAYHFDEMKMYIDAFSTLPHVNYDDFDTTPSHFLTHLSDNLGLDLPILFKSFDLDQYYDGKNLKPARSSSAQFSLREVQNKVWRRILTNYRHFINGKGTVNTIKEVVRCLGIDPDNSIRIREFGGGSVTSLKNSRSLRKKIVGTLNFSGSIADVSSNLDSQGIPDNKPFVISSFLSGTRVEVGSPKPVGTFTSKNQYYPHGASNNKSDGLFTSGSWTYEARYVFPRLNLTKSVSDKTPIRYATSQSLARICTTGSLSHHNLIFNLLVGSGSTNSELTLFARPGTGTSLSSSPMLTINLKKPNLNIFDGNPWYISFGRSEDKNLLSNSGSYFLRVGNDDVGGKITYFQTSSFFKPDLGLGSLDITQNVSDALNASGSFICIGSQSIDESPSLKFLNDGGIINDKVRTTNFQGRVFGVNFWSKHITESEAIEHVKNPFSLGVSNPKLNFNFTQKLTGSFERLRLNVSMDQHLTDASSSGRILLKDFSQNNLVFQGSGFEPEKSAIYPFTIRHTQLANRIDEPEAQNKVRVRSFKIDENIMNDDIAKPAPKYTIDNVEKPLDDPRLSIEFSVVDALNDDIVKILSSLEVFSEYIGRPESAFESEYKDLRVLRDVYFNRIVSKIDHAEFFKFFKWFDDAMGDIIKNFIPKKTIFLGTNFVIESHLLERAKFKHTFEDVYLNPEDRPNLKGKIGLSLYTGKMRKI